MSFIPLSDRAFLKIVSPWPKFIKTSNDDTQEVDRFRLWI